MRSIKLALFVLLLVTGCSFQREAGDAWVMTLPGTTEEAPPTTLQPATQGKTLKVNLPDTPSWLDSRRVAVRRPDGALDYYAGARWADMLPLQLQAALVVSLSNGSAFDSVVADDVAQPTQYRLDMRIDDFEVTHENGRPHAVASVTYTLLRQLKPVTSGSASGQANLVDETRAGIQQGLADAYMAMAADLTEKLEKSNK